MGTEIFTSITGGIATLGVFLLGIGWLVSKFKEGGDKAVSEKNKEIEEVNERLKKNLTELVESQGQKIVHLEQQQIESQKQIANLLGRVEELSKQNSFFTGTMDSALDRWFKENPEKAIELATIRAVRKTDL